MNEKNILKQLSLADSFTIMNGVAGLLSIFFVINMEKHISFVFILIALLADGADGVVARRYGGALGRYIDEFADIASFCIAPLIFAAICYEIEIDYIFYAIASFFFICGLLHLVNYHLNQKDYFIGIPTPAAGLIIVSGSFLAIPLFIILIMFVILGILMIAPIYYPRIKGYLGVIAICICGIAMTGDIRLVWVLLISLWMYTVIGPIYAFKRD